MKIDEFILRKTTCRYNFDCLSGDKTRLCKVKAMVGNDMLEVRSKIDIGCGYRIAFGGTTFCTCPTRVEIYNHYDM
jgi:hypothetical protein